MHILTLNDMDSSETFVTQFTLAVYSVSYSMKIRRFHYGGSEVITILYPSSKPTYLYGVQNIYLYRTLLNELRRAITGVNNDSA